MIAAKSSPRSFIHFLIKIISGKVTFSGTGCTDVFNPHPDSERILNDTLQHFPDGACDRLGITRQRR